MHYIIVRWIQIVKAIYRESYPEWLKKDTYRTYLFISYVHGYARVLPTREKLRWNDDWLTIFMYVCVCVCLCMCVLWCVWFVCVCSCFLYNGIVFTLYSPAPLIQSERLFFIFFFFFFYFFFLFLLFVQRSTNIRDYITCNHGWFFVFATVIVIDKVQKKGRYLSKRRITS